MISKMWNNLPTALNIDPPPFMSLLWGGTFSLLQNQQIVEH